MCTSALYYLKIIEKILSYDIIFLNIYAMTVIYLSAISKPQYTLLSNLNFVKQ